MLLLSRLNSSQTSFFASPSDPTELNRLRPPVTPQEIASDKVRVTQKYPKAFRPRKGAKPSPIPETDD